MPGPEGDPGKNCYSYVRMFVCVANVRNYYT